VPEAFWFFSLFLLFVEFDEGEEKENFLIRVFLPLPRVWIITMLDSFKNQNGFPRILFLFSRLLLAVVVVVFTRLLRRFPPPF
jgi:hypothetical protein